MEFGVEGLWAVWGNLEYCGWNDIGTGGLGCSLHGCAVLSWCRVQGFVSVRHIDDTTEMAVPHSGTEGHSEPQLQ
jgi:hypothetical protein